MGVGRATAKFLLEIKKIYGYSPKNIHYIGFSMGAQVRPLILSSVLGISAGAGYRMMRTHALQVGGFAGRHYHRLSGEKFGRMTILDAAAPGFEKYGVHVVKEDSEFTVAVHTSAGGSIVTGKVIIYD